MRREMRVGAVVLVAVVALGAATALGYVLGAGTSGGTRVWLSEWSRSAGFGGTAAIVAATIAYRAARASARRQQWVDRKVQWWARARWALERALGDDPRAQAIGLDMLDALARSEWAGEHEADLIDVVMTKPLGRTAPALRRRRPGDPGSGGRRAVPPPSDSTTEVGR